MKLCILNEVGIVHSSVAHKTTSARFQIEFHWNSYQKICEITRSCERTRCKFQKSSKHNWEITIGFLSNASFSISITESGNSMDRRFGAKTTVTKFVFAKAFPWFSSTEDEVSTKERSTILDCIRMDGSKFRVCLKIDWANTRVRESSFTQFFNRWKLNQRIDKVKSS